MLATVVDATASTAWYPLTITSYTFDFGDGTRITQTSPVATHVYARAGEYQLTVVVNDSNRLGGSVVTTWRPYPLPRHRTTSPTPKLPIRYRAVW